MSTQLSAAANAAPAIAGVRLTSVSKTYPGRPEPVAALRDVTLALEPGTMTAIMGPSGSGKSTFLQTASGLDRPTSGTVHLGDTELSALDEDARSVLRRTRIGFVFQAFNLIPSLTASQRSSTASGSPDASATALPSCPVASSNGSPSPGPSSPGPR